MNMERTVTLKALFQCLRVFLPFQIDTLRKNKNLEL